MGKTGTSAGTVSERAFRVTRDAMYRWIRRLYGDDHESWLASNARRYRAALARAQRREAEREAMYAEIRRVYGRGDDGAHLVQRVVDARRAELARTKQTRKQMAAAVCKVEAKRAQDTIDLLHRRGQIDGRQQLAGLSYRQWWNDCGGSMPCALDQSRIGSGSADGRSPTMAQLLAAERLRDAARILGLMDERIVRLVVVEGHTIEDVARMLFGHDGQVKRADALHAGQRLRLALDALAEHWFPRGRGFMRGDEVDRSEQTVQPGVVEPARVVHATARRIHVG
ncbi:hypothetical protein FHP25_24945 [Vineibacter terrae]|uniref:Uncharacterized protein n=1 Tax=Vineibacter terrae TaxID=2586908 RepID=A0A5C8PFZ4_9HYPH|nr:hypothetical protein [Vineibacter terrae]TXL72546.1 hypothetical protein FHP25_24945 [Vineibacter terrae]